MPKITIKVDHAACSGIASCIIVAPQFFVLDDENRALVVNPNGESASEQTFEVSEDDAKEIISAAESCPMVAIAVYDEEGKKLYG